MDHTYYKDRISAYLDGALPPYEQKAIGEHLAQCAECREILDRLRALNSLVEQKSGLGENDYWERQAQKIEQRLGIAETQVTRIQPTRTWQGVIWKLAAAAASIMIVGVIGFYSWESIRDKTERPPIEMAPAIPPTSIATPQKVEPAPENVKDERESDRAPVKESAPSESEAVTPDTQNYKRPAPTEKTLMSEFPETVSQPTIEKSSVSAKTKPLPVQSVDNLLRSDAESKTDADRGALIRGGRAGESSYQVESAASSPAIAPVPQAVRHEGEIQLLSVRPPEAVASNVAPADSLAYWLAQEKALIGSGVDAGKSISLMQELADKSRSAVTSSLAERKDTSDVPSRLLVAYYHIARLSADSSDVSRARAYLIRYSKDTSSSYQTAAKAYLDSLARK
ncbi:MAG: zf-HC2 domain-containing protein [candidate division Zixibacteria bacterium]|nr:zf-HC2 domain-containing protein [candidate division Zixibacteria bacterium]